MGIFNKLNAKKIKKHNDSLKFQLKLYKEDNDGFSLKKDLHDMLKIKREVISKNGCFTLDKLWYQHTSGNYISNNVDYARTTRYDNQMDNIKEYIIKYFKSKGYTTEELDHTVSKPPGRNSEPELIERKVLKVSIPIAGCACEN